MKKVMVFGTFDGLHPGHLNFFKQAMSHGDYLVIVVARDSNVKIIKGHNARLGEEERLVKIKKEIRDQRSEIKGNNFYINKAILGGLKDPYAVIRKEKPEVICLGYDQKSFDQDLKKQFPAVKIVRLKPFWPNKYKSSILANLASSANRAGSAS